MRASFVGAACAAVIVAGCGGHGPDRHDGGAVDGTLCTPGTTKTCNTASGRTGIATCGAARAYGACAGAACGDVGMAARGTLYTSAGTVPLAGAATAATFDATAATSGGGTCLAHAVLSATASGCGLDVELGVGEAPYGGVRSVVLTVGPACAGFTAAQEGVYVSPPSWAPAWWLGPTSFDAGVSCVPDAEVRFPDRVLRLARADGASIDVDLRDVVFAGDLRAATSTSPFLQCLTLACAPGMRDGGAGWCVAAGTCAKGFHEGGAGACLLEGTCARGYGLDASGACVGWAAADHLVQARTSAAAFRLPGGDVLLTGGYTPGSGPHDPVRSERYHPATRAWSETGAPHYKHEEGAYAQLPDGRVLATGGFDLGLDPEGGTTVAELYDPATATWTPVAPMIGKRYHHAAVTLADGRVLVMGGQPSVSATLASAEIYDPASNAWTTTGDLTRPRSSPAAALLSDGRIFVAGDFRGTDSDVWDPATGKFTAVANLSWYSPRLAPLADGRLVVLDDWWSAAVSLFDPRTMQRTQLRWFGYEFKGIVVPVGGSVVLAVSPDVAALVDVDAGTAAPVALPPHAYSAYSARAKLLLDGTVLFVSGGATADAADLYIGRW